MSGEEKKKTASSGKSAFRFFFEHHEFTKHCFRSDGPPVPVSMVVFDSLHTVWAMFEPEKKFCRDLSNKIVSDLYGAFGRGAQNVTMCFDKGASVAKSATQQQRHQQRHGLTKETKAAIEAVKIMDDSVRQQVLHTRTPLENLPADASKEQKKEAKAELARIMKTTGNEGVVMRARHNQYLVEKYNESLRRSELQVQAYRSEVGLSCFADHRSIERLQPFVYSMDDREQALQAVRHVMSEPLPSNWPLFCATNRIAVVRYIVQSILMGVIIPPSKEVVIDGHCCSMEDLQPSWAAWTKHTDRDATDISEVPLVVQPKGMTLADVLGDPRPLDLLDVLVKKQNATAVMETLSSGFAPNVMALDERLRNSCGEADFAVFYHILRFCQDRVMQRNVLGLRARFHIYSRDTDVLLYALLFLFRVRRGWFGDDVRALNMQLYMTYSQSSTEHKYVDINALYDTIIMRFFKGQERYMPDLVCVSFMTKSDYTSGCKGITMNTNIVTYLSGYEDIGHLVRPVKGSNVLRLQPLEYRRMISMAYVRALQRFKCYFTDYNPRYASRVAAVGESRVTRDIHCNLSTVREMVQEVKLKSIGSGKNAWKRQMILKFMDDERTNPSDPEHFDVLCTFLDSLVASDYSVEVSGLQLLWYFNLVDQVGAAHMYELPYEHYGYYMEDPRKGWVKSNVYPKPTSQAKVRAAHRDMCYGTAVSDVV